jgi:hypothetical protein
MSRQRSADYWFTKAAEARQEAEAAADMNVQHGLRNIAMIYDTMARITARAEAADQPGLRPGCSALVTASKA